MKWLLIVVVVEWLEGELPEPMVLDSKEACAAAGKVLVESYPGFEWHDPKLVGLESLVHRSHVRCCKQRTSRTGDGLDLSRDRQSWHAGRKTPQSRSIRWMNDPNTEPT